MMRLRCLRYEVVSDNAPQPGGEAVGDFLMPESGLIVHGVRFIDAPALGRAFVITPDSISFAEDWDKVTFQLLALRAADEWRTARGKEGLDL